MKLFVRDPMEIALCLSRDLHSETISRPQSSRNCKILSSSPLGSLRLVLSSPSSDTSEAQC
uniref:Uncharacterized protein n=1 Tax=Timema douglasi TaxID=61478 RepID=A0A7R8VMF7_TIMDO|nr:unnamed protein product [Timema douglasi]